MRWFRQPRRPLPDHLKAEILREIERLELTLVQLGVVEHERDAGIYHRPCRGACLSILTGSDFLAACSSGRWRVDPVKELARAKVWTAAEIFMKRAARDRVPPAPVVPRRPAAEERRSGRQIFPQCERGSARFPSSAERGPQGRQAGEPSPCPYPARECYTLPVSATAEVWAKIEPKGKASIW